MKNLLAASLPLCFAAAALAAPPDFSGSYVLDASSAPAAEGRRRPIAIVNIEQTAEKVVITEWYDKQSKFDSFECAVSGPCVYMLRDGRPAGQPGDIALSFEDGHLVIRSPKNGGNQALRRFALSADKKTLSLKELQAKPSTLVYLRE